MHVEQAYMLFDGLGRSPGRLWTWQVEPALQGLELLRTLSISGQPWLEVQVQKSCRGTRQGRQDSRIALLPRLAPLAKTEEWKIGSVVDSGTHADAFVLG